MTMDPALQHVDSIQTQDKAIIETGRLAEERNEETQTTEIAIQPHAIYEPGDEQGLKRSFLDEPGPSSQKKIKSDDGKDPLAEATGGVKEAESQNMPTDYYSNGIHAQPYPPQSFHHQQYPQTYHSEQFASQYTHQQYSGQSAPQQQQQLYERPPAPQITQQQHYDRPPAPQQQYDRPPAPQTTQHYERPPGPQQHYGGQQHQQTQPYPVQQYPAQNQYYPVHNVAQEYLHPQQSQQQPQHQPQPHHQQQPQHQQQPHHQQPPSQMQQYPGQQPPETQPSFQIPQYSGITVTRSDSKTDKYDVKAKLKDMGEISVETVKKTQDKKAQKDSETGESATKKTEEESSTVIERKGNMRKNIREVMDETKLDESTLAAQRQEMERLRRVQEQQRQIRDMQRQANQDRVMSLLQGNDFPLDAQEGPSSTKIGSSVLVRLPNGQVKPKLLRRPDSKSPTIDITPSSLLSHTNITPSVSIAPIQKRFIEPELLEDSDEEEEEEERDPLALTPTPPKSDEPVDVIDLSSDSDDDCIVVSETENDPEEDEDPTNSGMHTNDEFNQPNEDGKVVINVGHADDEPDVFVAPQIARIIKPHQIGGIRFLYDNIIESTKMYDTSTGFGCILAHSMGLGKTLQVVTFSDTFLRHTSAKTILCIMPINTLQNWLAEFNMWLPTEEAAKNSPLLVHGEVRPRNFNLHVLNDSHKTLAARAKVIHNWNTSGGVLLIGYEQYRLLSLKRCPKSRSKKAQQRLNDDDKNKHLFDEVHEALVQPGPDLVVCDEGHRIKNSHASISQALKLMRTKRRVVLTGYPLQNNLMEYWCMVDFVRPNYLGTKTEFCNMFERPIQNGQCIDSTENDIKLMRYRAHVLHSLLLGFVQRRSHRVLQTALPQKEEYVLLVRMTPFQRTLYETFMNEVVRSQTVPNPLKAFAVCCKIWNHPDVLYYYLKKQDKGGAVDIDLEEVTTVTSTPVNAKVPKPRVKKQEGGRSKKEKPAASVTPYNSNSSTAETNTSTSTSTVTASTNPNEPTQQRGSKGFQQDANSGSFPNQPNSQTQPPSLHDTMNNTNYPMGNYPPPQAQPINNYPGGNADYRANFNHARPQFTGGGNQYNYANPGGNYRMANDTRMAYPTPRAPQYNSGQPYGNYMHSHMQQQQSQPGNPQTHHQSQQQQQPQTHTYPNNPNHATNYQYGHNPQHNAQHNLQGHNPQGPPAAPGPSNYNMMYNSNPSYPNYQNYPNYNQGYWNPNQQPHYPQEVKPDPYAMPYDPNNQWKQEDVKIKPDVDTKPKINILSDICISNTYDSRGAPEKKINILSDIKLEPKIEVTETPEEAKTENSQDEQKLDDIIEPKVDKTELDEDVKCLSPVKLTKEDTGIPYDWAIELLKDYVPGFIENSAKMEILFSIIKESLALGDRLLVFSQSLITLDLIEQFLQMNIVPGDVVKWAKNTSYYRLDGSTTALEREKLINEFNSNSKVYLFLVSTRAGSLGINLIGANRVVVLDASWNPCHDTQAVCRVYRYGQRKPCFVYRLVVDNCLEKKIYDRQINKQGMSDRVVDECNPDAHLTMKDVTTLCWDGEQETEEKDWSFCKDKYIDVVLQKVLDQHGRRFNKEPFQHESLLIDRKDKQLSSLEKRMAKRGYEREKQAARQPNYSVGTGIRHRPVASVRPMQQAGDTRSSKWIPAEHWQRQGMTAQEMTLPLDVVIPTVQPDKGKIVLKAGQKVLILKSPKGVYMQLESGKIVSIKTAIKVRGKVDEDSNNSTTPPSQPSPSPPPNLPLAIKHSPAITVTTTPPKRAVKPFVSTPKLNIRARAPISPRLPARPVKKVQMSRNIPVIDEQCISSGDEDRMEDKRVHPKPQSKPPVRNDMRGRDISAMRDVRPVRQQFQSQKPTPNPIKGSSALQQLEKSTTAIISESKQPFQETLNSITKSYQEEEAKSAGGHPITIDDEADDKIARVPQSHPQTHPQTTVKPNIPPSADYGGGYGNYGNYGYNMSYSTPVPQQPQQQYGYSPQTAPPYDMNAYSTQTSQSHQSQLPQHPPVIPHTATQPPPPPPQSTQQQHHQQHPPHHQQQPAQTQYNYGGYPPHMYPTPAPPPQYATQSYDYQAPPPPPPPASQPQQPMYSAPYSYQYPPPGPPQPVYSTAPPAASGYAGGDYQYPAATAVDPAATAPPYYPPQP